jgi:nicotinamide-nucleotide amidase
VTCSSEAALILVGDELLSGRTRDVNMQVIARKLSDLGIRLTECRTVPDSVEAISSTLVSLSGTGLVITTGGLGPTDDDLTLEGISAATSIPLAEDPAASGMIRAGYDGSGMEMPVSALSQACIPRGSVPVENTVGIAPGVVLDTGSLTVISLPGVPGEVEALLPACLEKAGIRGIPRTPRVLLRTWGVPENTLYDILSPAASRAGAGLAFLPGTGRVDVSVSGATAGEFTGTAEQLLGGKLYGTDPDVSLEETVGSGLLELGWTLSVADSCTGGMLGAALTAVPGSSGWFAGGVISYTNEAKTDMLGVPGPVLARHGAVSREVVREMASGVAGRFSTEAAVAISGIAGPGGGTGEKPVGTVWIAVLAGDSSGERIHRFPGGRKEVRRAAVSNALGMVLEVMREGSL